MISIQEKQFNVILENVSQIIIRVITGAIKVSSTIFNIVSCIMLLVSAIGNIKFLYCRINATKLVDFIARKSYHCVQFVSIYQ